MCGIYGMVSDHNIVPSTLKGIKKLEYRGYDSAGIAYFEDDDIKVIKKVGEISVLEKECDTVKPQSHCAISHTRWATHGSPTNENAHPHTSQSKDFVIVHNGIIENYKELKEKHLKKAVFASDTDSEVIAQLLQHFYSGDVLQTLSLVADMLKGSYALAVIHKCDKQTIYATKRNSPLIVSKSSDGGIVSSDISALIGIAQSAYIIKNNEFVTVNKDNLTFYNNNLDIIEKKTVKVDDLQDEVTKSNYKHFMLKEIMEIPTVINNLLKTYPSATNIYDNVPKELLQTIKGISFVACGTAYHAGLIAKHLVETTTTLNVSVHIASEFRYSKAYFDKERLYVFISQSGETADTLEALKIARLQGAKTLSIVNVKNSSITYESHYNLYTQAGVEIGVASTKAYNSQVALLYLFVHAIIQARSNSKNEFIYKQCVSDISLMFLEPKYIKAINKKALKLAKNYKNAKAVYIIGRQSDYLTSQEAALKLKEITYLPCEAYPAGELKHGTISLIEKGTLVICFLTQKDIAKKTINALHEVKSRGAHILLVTTLQQSDIKDDYDEVIMLPDINDFYAPLVSIIALQLLSYHLSVQLNHNPDKPRNLAKSVTVE